MLVVKNVISTIHSIPKTYNEKLQRKLGNPSPSLSVFVSLISPTPYDLDHPSPLLRQAQIGSPWLLFYRRWLHQPDIGESNQCNCDEEVPCMNFLFWNHSKFEFFSTFYLSDTCTLRFEVNPFLDSWYYLDSHSNRSLNLNLGEPHPFIKFL